MTPASASARSRWCRRYCWAASLSCLPDFKRSSRLLVLPRRHPRIQVSRAEEDTLWRHPHERRAIAKPQLVVEKLERQVVTIRRRPFPIQEFIHQMSFKLANGDSILRCIYASQILIMSN